MKCKERAFSLYELLFTLAIAATILVIGVPSMSGFIARNRQQVEINALFHAVHVARKESIVRRRSVSICPSPDGRVCAPDGDWSRHWILFVNEDGDEPPALDDGEIVLQRHSIDASIRVDANRRGFTLRSTHRRATNGTIVACDIADRVAPKALVISWTGRPRIALRNSRGKAYFCAD